MGNGLFAVDGIDVAALVAEHIGPRVLPCVLIKPGAPGARDPDNPTKAPQPGVPTSIPCRGFIEDFSTYSVDGDMILVGDRKVTLLGATINGGLTEPEGGVNKDRVTVEGNTWAVWRVLSRDPAGATFVLQVRDPGVAA
jgi:hypothetical protein